MGNLARGFTIFALVAAACTEEGAQPPPARDVSDFGAVHDIIVDDTCQCVRAEDCLGKVETSQCVEALCNACLCQAHNKAKGTPCDDGNPQTIDDACDGAGVCQGVPVTCGNGKCEVTEHCGNCPNDCPCDVGEYCKSDKCVKPQCGNNECEPPFENCANCQDCACAQDEACYEKKCVKCPDYCKSTGKECGKPEGTPCDCGTCPPGKVCDALHHCYDANICGNHVCELGEDCSTCETDCGCEKGKKCANGQCVECEPICKQAGKECGFFQGCDCGACPVCYKCNAQGKCDAKCDCVCWQKECGEVAGCKCGPLNGACPAGQECVGYKCLVGCDTLCQGIECGWAQDCICDFCPGCDACHNNKCGPGAEMDEYEVYPYNDTWETATDLGQTTDDDIESERTIFGSIDIDFDTDWFKIEVQDTFGFVMNPVFTLTDIAEDKDLDLEVCFKCKSGATLGLAAEPKDSTIETESPIPGARCFASINLWGFSEEVRLTSITCEGGGANQSGTAYIHVMGVVAEDCGSAYTLRFHF